MSNKPLVEFAEAGTAPILSYNVSDPVSYFGTFITEFGFFPESYFRKMGDIPLTSGVELTVEDVRKAMLGGFLNKRIFPSDCSQYKYYEAKESEIRLLVPTGDAGHAEVPHLLIPAQFEPEISRDTVRRPDGSIATRTTYMWDFSVPFVAIKFGQLTPTTV